MKKLPLYFAVWGSLLAAIQLSAHSAGPDPGLSGAPGDSTCSACHGGPPNTGSGSVKIAFANPAYASGQKIRITVTVADPQARRWGFELSPRLSSNPSTGAGILTPVDGNTQIVGTSGSIQWIAHTLGGTRNGTTGSADFQFDWTAPDVSAGSVDFYAAGNAANGNGAPTGDLIYTTKASLAAGALPARPTIAQKGVVNGASFQPTIAAGSWISILGKNLSSTTRTWDAQKEIVNGVLPTSLDGVSVSVNGKRAAVYFISPTQINVQAPDDTATGPVNVVVTTADGTSDPIAAQLQTFSPALFLFDPQNRKYAASVAADGTFLAPASLFGSALTTRPAKPGETILLFGTGFGPTSPAVPSGSVFAGTAALANTPTVTIGGVQASVLFGGLSGAGLNQFNVVVPDVADGDQPVVISVGGVSSPAGVFLAVQR